MALSHTKETKAMENVEKSDTLETYLEKCCKPNLKLLELMDVAIAPISSVKMSSTNLYYIYLTPWD